MYTIQTEKFWEYENEMEIFLEKYDKQHLPVLIYGAGKGLDWVKRLIGLYDIEVSCVIDKRGSEVKDFPVLTIHEAREKFKNQEVFILVSTPKFEIEVLKELEVSFSKNYIFSFECELYYSYIHSMKDYRVYLKENQENLMIFMEDLQDEISKKTLNNVILGRVTGKFSYFREVQVSDQYFPKDIIQLKDETILDVGACKGDTVEQIVKLGLKEIKKVYCFEPDNQCLKDLEKNMELLQKPFEVKIIKKGAWKEQESLFFQSDDMHGASKIIEEGNGSIRVDLDKIDNLIDEEENITLIKMDIEGAELAALQGAVRTIRKCKPKLAICVYHKNEDFIQIPNFIREMVPEYKFYLRHHNVSGTETVLYAVI